jgi:hypothetical protein
VKCHYIIQTNGLCGALMAMPPRLEYPSARPRFAALSLKEGTEDEGNNNSHAGCDACAFELLVRRSRRPSRQKKPPLSRSVHESTNIGWHAIARVQNDT